MQWANEELQDMNASSKPSELVLALAICGILFGCQMPAHVPSFAELSYAHHGSILLDVERIEVVRAYAPPGKIPNVEHLSPVSPLATADRWINDRLRAVGNTGIAKATISRASIIEVPLKRTKGLRGVFIKDQAERYDGLIEISIQILGVEGHIKGSVLVRASRSKSVAEDISRIDREKIWFEMTEGLMKDLNTTLQKQIKANLGKFVR